MTYFGFHGAVEASRESEPAIPTVTLLRLPDGVCLVDVRRHPEHCPRPAWETRSETVAIARAGDALRDIPGCENAVLCVEWPWESVAHPERCCRTATELSRHWNVVRSTINAARHARANAEDRTTLNLDSVDGWASDNPWPSGIPGGR